MNIFQTLKIHFSLNMQNLTSWKHVICLIKWPTHVFIIHRTVACERIPGVDGQTLASLNSTLEVMGKGVLV